MIKLTDLPGAECLPKKQILKFDSSTEEKKRIAHNSAVSQMEKCGVGVDVEALIILIKYFYDEEIWKGENDIPQLARKIAQYPKSWIKIERAEGGDRG